MGNGRRKLSGDQVIKRKKYFSGFMALNYSDFVDNYKAYTLEPDIPAVTHIAPINSRQLSVSLLAPQLYVRGNNRRKGIFVDGICYLRVAVTNIKELRK